MKRLEQAKLFLDFYFASWGAAKGEIWEAITGVTNPLMSRLPLTS